MDQLVQLPPDALSAGQKYETINLLAAITRFALPSNAFLGSLERELESAFSQTSFISLSDVSPWLAQHGVTLQSLYNQATALANGDPEPLRQALQSGNDAQQLQLLAINDASKLIEMEDAGEERLTPRPLWSKPEGCLLLRYGYNTAMPFAYYAASLPGDSRRPVKIDWQSVVTAGVSGAFAILPPKAPVDLDRVSNSLHILTRALDTAHQAHADILDALSQSAPAAPVLAPQAV